ncbi:origin recognition complex subunit 4 C-terminus-domain-containing protein [Delphinella strobiligena]|nr:origin recognition complex subunit 4 C-terminus-domain-containing protein [Delphinella strobiligena]
MESPRSAKRRKVEAISTPKSAVDSDKAATRSSARKAPTSTPLEGNIASTTRSSVPRTTASHKSTGSAQVDIYDDIEGANTPTVTRSNSTRAVKAKSGHSAAERKQIGNEASQQGLNSLRARLNARLAAQTKERQASAATNIPTTATAGAGGEDEEPSGAGTPKSVGRPRSNSTIQVAAKENVEQKAEMSEFERLQYEKVIKRMAAKEKAAAQAAERIRIMEARARGEEIPIPARKPRTPAAKTATPKSANGVQKTSKATPKPAVEEQAAAHEDEVVSEDTACKVCGKLNSAKTNVMVLCDGCNNAYHQKCHDPPIPAKALKDEDSDWFCLDCKFKQRAIGADVRGSPMTVDHPAGLHRPSSPEKPAPKKRGRPKKIVTAPAPAPAPAPALVTAPDPAPVPAPDPVAERPRELSPMILDLPEERASLIQKIHAQAASPAKLTTKPTPQAKAQAPPQPAPQPAPRRQLTNASVDLSISPTDLQSLQQTILQQLTNRRQNTLVGLDSETHQIASLVDQTISAGESNSLLVIGARGSGKTAVVESILSSQTQKQADAFHVVRLNGFIHTDDKIALREIWRQLGREMQTDDFEAGKNYADALTTLLALLSHPSEIGQEGEGELVKSKSVIFILDEFDLFTTHPRQTLLYNLFDIAQSRKAPILVLGLTTRFDVAEQLEKRVKSRFSHRFVHLGLAKNIDAFKGMCRSCLLPANCEDDDAISEEGMKTWEALLTDLFESEGMEAHVRRIYYTTKSIPAFRSSLLIPFTTLPLSATSSQDEPLPGEETAEIARDENISTQDILAHFAAHKDITTSTSPPDSKLLLLHTLSTLQLALLISAARLTIIHDTDVISFALAYEEYKTLASRARIASSANAPAGVSTSGVSRIWGKDVAKAAWEGLVDGELVMAEPGRSGQCRVDVLLEEIKESGVDMGMAMRGWCREI